MIWASLSVEWQHNCPAAEGPILSTRNAVHEVDQGARLFALDSLPRSSLEDDINHCLQRGDQTPATNSGGDAATPLASERQLHTGRLWQPSPQSVTVTAITPASVRSEKPPRPLHCSVRLSIHSIARKSRVPQRPPRSAGRRAGRQPPRPSADNRRPRDAPEALPRTGQRLTSKTLQEVEHKLLKKLAEI